MEGINDRYLLMKRTTKSVSVREKGGTMKKTGDVPGSVTGGGDMKPADLD